MIPSLENKYHENKELSSPCEKMLNGFTPCARAFQCIHLLTKVPPRILFLLLGKPILKHFFNNSASDRQTARGEFARPISKGSKYISPKVYRVYIYFF